MPWTLFRVPASRRPELEAVLKDDQLSRQSQKLREASGFGGPAGELYVLVEGGAPAVERARELLGPIGTRLEAGEAEALYRRLRDEDENASAGMGLFFTE